ncbi:STE3-like pheromone receptor [Auricularia subglabra TFB-10046 SS5]|nr:STE3-like pheromone receptor [Auricularia subglabra TFB-10046 SS5]
MLDVPYLVIDSLAIFLVLVPMPWHISAWNSATCYLMIWTVIGCVIHLVNSIIWHESLANPNPTYCDISTKILMGLSVAIPLSTLCINRRLYKIATTQTVVIDRASKRRNIIIDTLIAVLCPLIFMAVHYTQQGHRYDIVENYGCWPTTYLTALGYIFVIVPPIIVCSISLVYCTLSIRAFLKRRQEFNDILRVNSGLNSHRYFRLMALASTEILIGLPTSLFFLITNLKSTGVMPWISWDDTHLDFNRVTFFPAYFFKLNPALRVGFELNRWAFPFIAFTFFAFFGLADEARRNYRAAFNAVGKLFGIAPKTTTSSSLKGGS